MGIPKRKRFDLIRKLVLNVNFKHQGSLEKSFFDPKKNDGRVGKSIINVLSV